MNNKVTSLIINVIVLIIAALGIYFIIAAMGSDAVVDEETRQMTQDTGSVSSAVNFSLITLIISLATIAVFTVIAIISNPKRFIPVAIGIGVFAVLILIAYTMTDISTDSAAILDLEGRTEQNSLWAGVGINSFYVLLVVAIGLIIVQGARNLIGYFTK